jgi:hypothetical protein
MTRAWQAVNWKLPAFAVLAVWFPIGWAVARHVQLSPETVSIQVVRAEKVTPTPLRIATATAEIQTGVTLPGGEWAWSNLATALEPRLLGLPAAVQHGPFAAKFHDPPPLAEPEAGPLLPATVFRRAMDKNPNPARLPPPVLMFGKPTLSTYVGWEKNPDAALDAAAERDKLAVVFQFAGPDGGFFMGNDPNSWRSLLLTRKLPAEKLQESAAVAIQKVQILRSPREPRRGGAAVAIFLAPDGAVLHLIPGVLAADPFFEELQWAQTLHQNDGTRENLRQAHIERLRIDHKFTMPVDALPRLEPFRPSKLPLMHPAVAALKERAKVHALLAAYPKATLEEIVPLLWGEILVE